MKLDSIRVVLVETTHPGNIGSAARAMKTMGLTKLYLVNPNLNPYRKAHELASGAYDVLQNAVIKESLEATLQGCKYVFATSARPREIALQGLSPPELANFVANQDNDTEVAVIFGREHAGLTNEELLLANYHINIASDPNFSSLNLAHAVQIISYELRMKILEPKSIVTTKASDSANFEDIERFYAHLDTVLTDIDFIKSNNHQRIMQKLKRLFNRANLEKMEVNILRGILSQIEASINDK